MSKAAIEDRQANRARPQESLVGGFEDTGREVVKKTYKSGKAAEKPDFFMGGCDPTVPTGPKRKLRTSWMAGAPAQKEEPPPVPKSTKKWSPPGKKLPTKAATHDGTTASTTTTTGAAARKARKPFKPTIKEEKEEEEETKTESTPKESEKPKPAPKSAPAAAEEEKKSEATEQPPPKAKKPGKVRIPTTAPRSVTPPPGGAKPRWQKPPQKKEEEDTTTNKGAFQAKLGSPVKAAKKKVTIPGVQKEEATPAKSPTTPTTKRASWKPVPKEEPPLKSPTTPTNKRPSWKPAAAVNNNVDSNAPADSNGNCAVCAQKDELIQKQAEEIEKLKTEKGQLAKEVKKIKGSQKMNKELKDEIFELKQQVSKQGQQDQNSKGFHKLENKLNTLKMIMDKNIDTSNLEELKDHLQMLEMILNQDLKKQGMRNIWA